jgi:hypothetical protein
LPSVSPNDPILETISATKPIPLSLVRELEECIERLNRRAGFLGCPAVVLKFGVQSTNAAGQRTIAVSISGKAPRLKNGWCFLAYAYNISAGSKIYILPGRMEPPEENGLWVCDHCRIRKPGRREAFVFADASGKEIKVGSCCISDLNREIGVSCPAALVWTAQVMSAIECGRLFFGLKIEVEDAVAAAACAIRHFGWSGLPLAWSPDFHIGRRAEKILDHLETKNGINVLIEDEDVALARAAMTWAQKIPNSISNDDFDKLRIVAQLTWIFRSEESELAASMIAAYQETMGRAPTGERRSDPSRHVGIIGQRGDFIATIDRIIDIKTITGARHVHLFRDPAGNVLKWTAYSETPIGVMQRLTWRSPRLIEGQVYELRKLRSSCTKIGAACGKPSSRNVAPDWSADE